MSPIRDREGVTMALRPTKGDETRRGRSRGIINVRRVLNGAIQRGDFFTDARNPKVLG